MSFGCVCKCIVNGVTNTFLILCDFKFIETQNAYGHDAKPTTGMYLLCLIKPVYTCLLLLSFSWLNTFFNRTCHCFQQMVQCFIRSCLQNRALVESFTTLLVSQPRSGFGQLTFTSLSCHPWLFIFQQGSNKTVCDYRFQLQIAPPRLSLSKPFGCFYFLSNYNLFLYITFSELSIVISHHLPLI